MKGEQVSRMTGAAAGMLEMLTGCRPTAGQPGVAIGLVTGHQINVVSVFSGSLEGTVLYGMSIATADRLASRVLGQPIVTFDQSAAMAICGFIGRISGSIAGALLEMGNPVEVDPSVIIRGANVPVQDLAPTIAVPLTLEPFGLIEIQLSLRSQDVGLSAAA